MQKELPIRKRIRLEGYDYSSNGAYFITICTQKRLHLFEGVEDVVGQGLCSCRLTPIGEIIEREWYSLIDRYPHITFDKFVVMPNHVHEIISINRNLDARQEQSPCPTCPTNPTVGDIICAYKSITTKLCNKNDNITGRKIWHFRYHDHIIRNETEYQRIWQYIDENPIRWAEDEFYK